MWCLKGRNIVCWVSILALGLVSANNAPSFPFYPYKVGTQGAFLIATNTDMYGAIGLSASTYRTPFPEVVVACMTPKDVEEIACALYTCTDADTCVADAAVAKFSHDEDKKVGILLLTDPALKDYTSIYWLEGDAPNTLDVAAVSGKQWELYPVTPYTTKLEPADFKYSVSVGKEDNTTSERTSIIIETSESSLVALGFRRDASAEYPEYVILCTTAGVSRRAAFHCKDAVCTDHATCKFTKNNLRITFTLSLNKRSKWVMSTKTSLTLATHAKFSFAASFKAEEVPKLKIEDVTSKRWKFQVIRTSSASQVVPSIISLWMLLLICTH